MEGCNYVDFPMGGSLTFVKQLCKALGNRLALVGLSTDETPVGRWVQRRIDGVEYAYFATHHCRPQASKPLIPARITCHWNLRRHLDAIRSVGIGDVFISSPELLMAASSASWDSICYCFPGVENPVANSRYPWLRWTAALVERRLFKTLKNVDRILASADDASIDALVKRSRGLLSREQIVQFPTRFDSDIFRPQDKQHAREQLGLNGGGFIVVASGRLNWGKGWDLILESAVLAKRDRPELEVVFVGDGEDRQLLRGRAQTLGLQANVRITGYVVPEQVSAYLNAADVVAVGSHREGWSIAMLEAIACGKAIVTTAVSGATAMVRDGENGFVIGTRDPQEYAQRMLAAASLPGSQQVSLEIARQYDSHHLASDLAKLWPPMAKALQQ